MKFISTLEAMPEKGKEVLIKTKRGVITKAVFTGATTRPGQPYPVFMRDNNGYGCTVSAVAYEWCEIPRSA